MRYNYIKKHNTRIYIRAILFCNYNKTNKSEQIRTRHRFLYYDSPRVFELCCIPTCKITKIQQITNSSNN